MTIINGTATNNGSGNDCNGFKLGRADQKIPPTVTNCTPNTNKVSDYDGNDNTGHITTIGSGSSGNGKALLAHLLTARASHGKGPSAPCGKTFAVASLWKAAIVASCR